MSDVKWCHSHSLDKDYWNGTFDTKKEAIADAESSYCDGYTREFYIGQAVVTFQPFIDADDVLERIAEEAYDENEYAEEYLDDVTTIDKNELSAMLNSALKKWLKKHPYYKPTFYSIKHIEKVMI